MPIVAPPNPESRKIGQNFTDLELRMKRVEAGLRTVQLGNSSLDGNGLNMFDAAGNYRGTIGFQADGTTTVTSQNPDPPPVPGAPVVIPGMACLIVKHDGATANGSGNPADLSHYNVYTADVGLPAVRTLRGTITPLPGEFVVTGLDYTTYLVDVTAVNLGGKESAPSQTTPGAPLQVVGADIIAGAVTALQISANAVTAAALAANAVTTTKIADGSISTPKIIAGAVGATEIAANSINAGHIVAASITGDRLVALTISANELASNSVTAGKIVAGAVTATKLEANLVIASRIIAGTSIGARVEMHPTSGLQAFKSDGTTRTFWIDASTGNFTAIGTIATATSGSRIELNTGGTSPDTARFYQGSVFAQIYADPAPGSTAAVVMAGSGTSSGKLGAYPSEGFTSWFNGTVSQSAISCVATAASIWGGNIGLEGRAQWSTGLVQFTFRDSAGNVDSTRTLQYKGAGGGEPALYSPNFDTQIVWISNGLTVQSSAGITKTFVGASSRKLKKGEKVIQFGNRSPLATVMALVPKQWNYDGEWVEGEAKPNPHKITVKRDDEYDDKGRLVKEGKFVEIDGPPPVKTKPHFGLIAEDILAIAPDLVVQDPGVPGGLGLVDRDITAVLWAAVIELAQRVVALEKK